MSISRRFVLKGMALGSSVSLAAGIPIGALADAIATSTGTGPDLMLLVNVTAAEPAFLQGAMAAGSTRLQVQRVSQDLDLDFILALEHRMRVGALRIIGLLDDASATLVVDMARSAGARVQWLGQHSVAPGFAHHRLLTTDSVGGCARQFGDELQAAGAGFSLYEERLSNTMTPRQLSGPSRRGDQSAQWAATLGYLLASPGPHTSTMVPDVPAASVTVTGRFVSFSIEA